MMGWAWPCHTSFTSIFTRMLKRVALKNFYITLTLARLSFTGVARTFSTRSGLDTKILRSFDVWNKRSPWNLFALTLGNYILNNGSLLRISQNVPWDNPMHFKLWNKIVTHSTSLWFWSARKVFYSFPEGSVAAHFQNTLSSPCTLGKI